ncbi:acyl-CoA thioesterase [Nocardia harenae]|uniref:acyl-CoA thioesterase n=1 Tax=Nocardia harenae TaxID=358707 RepID=UPI00083041F6|nr:thioesterase family protein [Nocardia harenae]
MTVQVPIRTHYYQFDQQGVAFNMWYMAFIEEARNGFLAAQGYSLETLLGAGFDIQVVHTRIDWTSALRYGDPLVVEVMPGNVGTTSLGLDYRFLVAGEVRATAAGVYVIVDAALQGKAALPDGLRAALTA